MREYARGVKKGRRLQFLTFVVLEEVDRTGQRHSPTYAARSLLQIVMVYIFFPRNTFFPPLELQAFVVHYICYTYHGILLPFLHRGGEFRDLIEKACAGMWMGRFVGGISV